MKQLSSKQNISSRLYNLDYLRGIVAFAIMIYHYLLWSLGEFSSENIMQRIGIYGVVIFYILSGLTLYYVYWEKLTISRSEILLFLKKRIFRILPLLWIVTLISIYINDYHPSYLSLFLNFSGLFGFFTWSDYYSTGVWSIGNELVFYTFFPLIVFLLKRSNFTRLSIISLLLGIFLYFTFVKIDANNLLSHQWDDYINPLNQIFFFLSGILICHFFKDIKISSGWNLLMLIVGLLLFIFYPVYGDSIHLVTGSSRIIFTISCILICISFYKSNFRLPQLIHKGLLFLGDTSYSIYLLHPIIWTILYKMINKGIINLPYWFLFPLSIFTTLLISHFVYKYFEKFFIKIGNKL